VPPATRAVPEPTRPAVTQAQPPQRRESRQAIRTNTPPAQTGAPKTAQFTGPDAYPADKQSQPWTQVIDDAQVSFIASRNGRVYHLPSCEGGRKTLLRNLVNYESPEAALADGRNPCRYCKPPKKGT
jgi:hypothetical protein